MILHRVFTTLLLLPLATSSHSPHLFTLLINALNGTHLMSLPPSSLAVSALLELHHPLAVLDDRPQTFTLTDQHLLKLADTGKIAFLTSTNQVAFSTARRWLAVEAVMELRCQEMGRGMAVLRPMDAKMGLLPGKEES